MEVNNLVTLNVEVTLFSWTLVNIPSYTDGKKIHICYKMQPIIWRRPDLTYETDFLHHPHFFFSIQFNFRVTRAETGDKFEPKLTAEHIGEGRWTI